MAEDEADLEEDELSRPPPPSPIAVARRALVLSGVVCRASIENYKDEKYKRQTAEEIHEWFDELDLWPHLEAREEQILRAEFGLMPRWLRVAGTWFVEGLAILAWASAQRLPSPRREGRCHRRDRLSGIPLPRCRGHPGRAGAAARGRDQGCPRVVLRRALLPERLPPLERRWPPRFLDRRLYGGHSA